jgi:DNA-binding NarL/FixJ family response regulator
VASGGKYLSSSLAGEGFADTEHEAAPLSSREREVLQLLAEGKSTRETAARLFVSVKTVETHRQHVMRKLDLHTVAELTRYAIREGIVAAES